VLVAAGLDPTGGAGLVADVEALVAVGARAMAVATALTLQGPRGAAGWEVVPPRFLARQVEELLRGRGERPRALKTGMLGGASTAAHLARLFSRRGLAGLPLVVDPVLAASSGLSLLGHGHRRSPAAVLAPLLARATLVTPNLPELAALAGAAGGAAQLQGDDDAVEAARRLPCEAVLVKGGHREGAPVDLLVRGKTVVRFTGRRRAGTARGTGCRLASAIAGLLAAGAPLEEAVRGAKRVVERYLDAR
jgi:hydroxymethylpyrimidine/phosphomethylpyrimidine kinase